MIMIKALGINIYMVFFSQIGTCFKESHRKITLNKLTDDKMHSVGCWAIKASRTSAPLPSSDYVVVSHFLYFLFIF